VTRSATREPSRSSGVPYANSWEIPAIRAVFSCGTFGCLPNVVLPASPLACNRRVVSCMVEEWTVVLRNASGTQG
jgi:hypothetical protein